MAKTTKWILCLLFYFFITATCFGMLNFDGTIYKSTPDFLTEHSFLELIIVIYVGGLIGSFIGLPLVCFLIYLMIDNDII